MRYRDAPPPKTSVTIAGRTHAGGGASINEDAFVVVDLSTGQHDGPRDVARDGAAHLASGVGVALAVLDGMGGSRAGDVACRVAVDALRGRLLAAPAPPR